MIKDFVYYFSILLILIIVGFYLISNKTKTQSPEEFIGKLQNMNHESLALNQSMEKISEVINPEKASVEVKYDRQAEIDPALEKWVDSIPVSKTYAKLTSEWGEPKTQAEARLLKMIKLRDYLGSEYKRVVDLEKSYHFYFHRFPNDSIPALEKALKVTDVKELTKERAVFMVLSSEFPQLMSLAFQAAIKGVQDYSEDESIPKFDLQASQLLLLASHEVMMRDLKENQVRAKMETENIMNKTKLPHFQQQIWAQYMAHFASRN